MIIAENIVPLRHEKRRTRQMKLGIYEQIINQLFETKISAIDPTRFYIGKRTIKKDEVAKLLSMYLSGIFEQMLLGIANTTTDVEENEECTRDKVLKKKH